MFSRIQTAATNNSKGWIVVVVIYACLVILLTGVDHLASGDTNTDNDLKINAANTAFILICCALVMIMALPGVALCYAGFAEHKSQINTMAMVFLAYAIVTIIWTFWGYALAFGTPTGGFIGSGRHIFLQGLAYDSINPLAPTIPEYAFIMYQLTFAAVAVAQTAGGMMDRMKIQSWIVFVALWTTIVYVPIAHWVWGGGFLSTWGVLDFAGGTVVYINSGIGTLVGSVILGKPKQEKPNLKSSSFIVIGTGLTWFGWLGFNAGSALAANGTAAIALINTNLSAAVGALAWVLLQACHTGKPTLGGLCDGAFAGLVCITPAAGYVNTLGAFILGILALVSYAATQIKERTDIFYDPANAFCVNFVGGTIGGIFVGVYADPNQGGKAGFLFGNFIQLAWQLAGIGIVIAYSAVLTAAILFLLKYTVGLRVDELDEKEGLDKAHHGEFPYSNTESLKAVPNTTISIGEPSVGPLRDERTEYKLTA